MEENKPVAHATYIVHAATKKRRKRVQLTENLKHTDLAWLLLFILHGNKFIDFVPHDNPVQSEGSTCLQTQSFVLKTSHLRIS